MKILFCNFEYPPLGGGGGIMNARLAEELVRRGHQTLVLTSGTPGLPSSENLGGVQVKRVPIFFGRRRETASFLSMAAFMRGAVAEGKRLLLSERFDVINTQFVLPSGPVGDSLAHWAGIRNVLTVYGGDLYDPSKFFSPHRHMLCRMWIRRLLRRADALIGPSSDTLANIRAYYAPELAGVCIPLGICPLPAPSGGRAKYGFAPSDVLLISVGRLIRRKAVDQLIAMMRAFPDGNVHLLIVGMGPEEDRLKRMAESLPNSGRVHFLGYVSDSSKAELLQMSDIYVSPTQHEGFCLSFLEAMEAGLPIVAYDKGGHADYLTDGQTGYLAPLNDLERFAGHCRELAADKELCSKLGRRGKEVAARFSIERCAAAYEEQFSAICGKRRPEGSKRR